MAEAGTRGGSAVTSERWARLKALFDQAVEQPAFAREAWADGACADDAELRTELQAAHQAQTQAAVQAAAPAAARRTGATVFCRRSTRACCFAIRASRS